MFLRWRFRLKYGVKPVVAVQPLPSGEVGRFRPGEGYLVSNGLRSPELFAFTRSIARDLSRRERLN